ncbi:hypothetical protein Tco_1432673 [Tanacetum coccineum]
MVSAAKDPLTFDELMATPIDFSKYAMNHLKIDKLTKAHLVGPVYNLLKGTCKSSVELEYNMKECYKALSDQLGWNNPEGDRCPYNLSTPLPLKGHPGRLTIPSEYFLTNNLKYLKSSNPKKNATKVGYDKDASFGIKHWGPKRQQFFRAQLNRFSKHNVYSTQKILSVVSVKINKLHVYGHLEAIVMRRADRQKYTFKEGDFVNLHLNDIDDVLLLVAQHKLFNLEGSDIVDLAVALQLYTPSFDPPGAVYKDLNKQKRVMRADEFYKFSDGTLNYRQEEVRAYGQTHLQTDARKTDHKESGKIDGCMRTRDGLQVDA